MTAALTWLAVGLAALTGSERARIAAFFDSTGSLEREVALLDDRRDCGEMKRRGLGARPSELRG